jgi:hypothetical protein
LTACSQQLPAREGNFGAREGQSWFEEYHDMIGDTAACLVKEAPEGLGGVWTPGTALDRRLINRLTVTAGMTVAVER